MKFTVTAEDLHNAADDPRMADEQEVGLAPNALPRFLEESTFRWEKDGVPIVADLGSMCYGLALGLLVRRARNDELIERIKEVLQEHHDSHLGRPDGSLREISDIIGL